MAKPKTKRGPMDTTATEVQPGDWCFETGDLKWTWTALPGINLLVQVNDDLKGVFFAKSLDHAIMFAWGFLTGRNNQRQWGKDTPPM